MNDRLRLRLRLRFWDKEERQYLKPSFFDSIWFDKDGGIHVGCYSDIVGKVVDYTNDVDIEQCTGLSDKNGKLIYEGDILLLHNNKFEVENNNITVFFKCLTDEYTHIDPMDFDYNESEIIGNTHENQNKGGNND